MKINKNIISKALRETIDKFLINEDNVIECTDGACGGGALTGAFLDGSGQADTSMGITYPLFGGKPLKQANNFGKMTKTKKKNNIDTSAATARHDGKGGSISIPKRKKK